ncbi:VOC family protein [Archangium lansingense]|uniref:VOC family protein n=1 Tax=Archangium lansingense TaxID=2995310 RepID=A0ABT4A6L5_9BACT|nr:VOC family protein [Archangium lansinium]MCY1077260.1 VOC family protein [Archangium lansinium]
MIRRVTHVTIYVKNDDEALAFFTGKLGFQKKMDSSMGPGGPRWITVSPPGQSDFELTLLNPATWLKGEEASLASGQIGQQPMIILDSDDIDGDYRTLKAAGVTIDLGVRDLPWGRDLIFRDLYGNRYNLVQSKPG